ncbi:MAG TPA: Ger(x)C family spore germination C-terminal domain-containing protein, partial [Clostridia bacterium]|nr:Ger(x)C family spore germination C-terminal domain-containing protein [Clostridia bacterium]
HRLIGYLNGLHTQVVLIIKGQFEKGRIQLPLPDGRIISVRLSAQSQPKIRLILSETSKATFEIALYANVEHPELREYSNSGMEILISEFLKKRAEEVFLACQALGSDVFELRNAAVKLFRCTSDWEAFNWDAAFKEVAAAFEIAVYLDYNPSKSSVE